MAWVLSCSLAWAFGNYDGCEICHGNFTNTNYTSLQDGTQWGVSLMSGHRTFVNDNCLACHVSIGPGAVRTNESGDLVFTKSCVGCHGRDEDVNGDCTGEGGGAEVECGSGAGLRRFHETNVGEGSCTECHAGDVEPVGENVAPFNYSLAGSAVKSPCNTDGSESRFGPTGLDNDGDGLRDAADPDCGVRAFEINAGLSDAWVSGDADKQGFFFTVFADFGFFFLSWFTFDSVIPDESIEVGFGARDHRWVTGLGVYSGDSVTIDVELTTGGIFNASEPEAEQVSGYGTITLVFKHCNEAELTYDFPGQGLSGQMTLTRALPDNVTLCESLLEG